MNKTILCTLVGSVISLNASAATLNVEGVIQLNGKTVLETVNLDKYEAAGQVTQTYTAYSCNDTPEEAEQDCGTFIKTITITSSGENHEQEIEEIRDHHGDLISLSTFTQNGNQYTSLYESYQKGYQINWSNKYWVNGNGDQIVINGMTAYEGMWFDECDDDGVCESKQWFPSEGDQVVEDKKITNLTYVSKSNSSWTEITLKERNTSAITIGLPTVSIRQVSKNQSTYEHWEEIQGNEGRVNYSSGNNNSNVAAVKYHSYSVLAKIPTFNGYQDCILIGNGNDSWNEIKCAGKGIVSFTEDSYNGYYGFNRSLTWELTQ